MAPRRKDTKMAQSDTVSPEFNAAEADAASTNGAVLVNGTPITHLEQRIEKELAARRETMRARAAYGDELYNHVRAIVNGYRSLESKNIPAPARKALSEASAFLDLIDSSTRNL